MAEGDVRRPPIATIDGRRGALGPLRRDLLPASTRRRPRGGRSRCRGPTARCAWVGTDAGVVRRTVDERANRRPIGIAHRPGIAGRHGTAALGLTLGEAATRGEGCGTETTRLLRGGVGPALGLHHVTLGVSADNPAGLRASRTAAVRECGRRRQHPALAPPDLGRGARGGPGARLRARCAGAWSLRTIPRPDPRPIG